MPIDIGKSRRAGVRATGVLLVLLTGGAAAAQQPPRVVTLEEALGAAQKLQPQLRQARATTEEARAMVAEARAPLFPQALLSFGYQRATANFISRPGALPQSAGGGSASEPTSWKTFGFFSGNAGVNQLLWDFNQTTGRLHAAQSQAEAQRESERAVMLQVTLLVRSVYFTARANKALVGVARETVRNLEKHLAQTEGFVTAGMAPEIDLALARSNLATGRSQLIGAENAYLNAKAQLNQAVGWDLGLDYDVADLGLEPVEGEDAPLEALEKVALEARPELASLQRQVEARRLTVRALEGAYGPTLAGSLSFSPGGSRLDALSWNAAAGLTLSWPIFEGGLTRAQVRAAEAVADQLSAQLDIERLQVRLDLEQARLAVRAAKASLVAQRDAVLNARERLRLAEGRYGSGVGSGIELSDAQVALSTAEAQLVQADGQLATARSQLLHALGRW
ncbi:TolC family protein [Hyalangium versicolor]|uniref:TolC family protein n=1 Tax=Hyalangium versicolor TaxID=2861190 RepID=UPI001CCBC47E|nr:TolC family protein [Hyalangium versicolor]